MQFSTKLIIGLLIPGLLCSSFKVLQRRHKSNPYHKTVSLSAARSAPKEKSNEDETMYSGVFRDEIDMDSLNINDTFFFTSLYKKKVSFEFANFLGDAGFTSSKFDTLADFDHARFCKAAPFFSAHFNSAEFYYCDFAADADFHFAGFDQAAAFDNVKFHGNANLSNMHFHGPSRFIGTVFSKAAQFSETLFADSACFVSTEFKQRASFDLCIFPSDNDFSYARFAKTASFTGLVLSKNSEFDFTGAILPDTIDFSYNARIFNEIDLTNANFDNRAGGAGGGAAPAGPIYINLYRTDISMLHLDYIHFRLYFSNFDWRFNGPPGTVSVDEKNAIYESLLNNFKSRGQTESYKLLDIAYQQFRLDAANHPFYKWLFRYWWNYGYDKEYVFLWTAGFLLLFSLVNFCCLGFMNKRVYVIESLPEHLPQWLPLADLHAIRGNLLVLLRRLWYALFYTSAIFFKLSLKIENFKFKSAFGTIYLVLIYVAGLICLAYMANFVLQR